MPRSRRLTAAQLLAGLWTAAVGAGVAGFWLVFSLPTRTQDCDYFPPVLSAAARAYQQLLGGLLWATWAVMLTAGAVGCWVLLSQRWARWGSLAGLLLLGVLPLLGAGVDSGWRSLVWVARFFLAAPHMLVAPELIQLIGTRPFGLLVAGASAAAVYGLWRGRREPAALALLAPLTWFLLLELWTARAWPDAGFYLCF